MLTATRNFTKSPIAWGLFALLIMSFMIFGIGDVFTRPFSQDVINAGDRKVTPAQYMKQFDQDLKAISEQEQRPVSRDEVIAAGLHDRLLENMVIRESVAEATERLNLRPSARLIAKELEGISAFFSQITGKFDKDAYRSRVAEQGYTVADFERLLADQLAGRTLMSGLVGGFAPPRTYGALVALNQFENRSLEYVYIDARRAPQPAEPTDAQLIAFMNEPNIASRLKKAEQRDLSVVRFSTRAAAPAAAIDEAELKKLFEFRLPAISQPELRSFVQIPAKDAAGAKAAADRLAKGEDPTAIAKALGVDPVVYDQKPKSAVPDAKVRDAAFALQAGQVSGPIQGALGYAAVKVMQVTPGRTPTLEEVRPQLEMELRRDIAQKTVFDAAEKFQKAQEGGADFAAAAKAAGVEPVAIAAVTRDQGMPQAPGGPPPRAGLSPKLVEKAFAMAKGDESDIEDEGAGEYFVVRVESITPAAMPALNEVRKIVTEALMARQVQEQLSKQAEDLATKVRGGQTLEAAAAAAGLTVSIVDDITFTNQGQKVAQILGRDGLTSLFRSKPGEVFVTGAAQPGYIVGKVVSVKAGDMTEMARSVDRQRNTLGERMVGDVEQLTALAARRGIKPRVNIDRAHAALGIEAPAAPAPAAKKDKKGKAG